MACLRWVTACLLNYTRPHDDFAGHGPRNWLVFHTRPLCQKWVNGFYFLRGATHHGRPMPRSRTPSRILSSTAGQGVNRLSRVAAPVQSGTWQCPVALQQGAGQTCGRLLARSRHPAARQDRYADASIGNVTGSNSVNVFLGIGLPWRGPRSTASLGIGEFRPEPTLIFEG